jgi:hypothetical protein
VRSLVSLLLLASLAGGASIPKTLISEAEAEPIRSAIVRKEAWTADAVRRLRAEAERRMKDGPWTVTSDRPSLPDLDPHDYYSEAPYWWPDPEHPGGPYIHREGQAYPGRFIANKTALNQMADSVFTLGAAAFLLNEPRYARRAAHLINAWFINPKTRMSPNLEHAQAIPGVNRGQSGGIIEGRAFIRAIQGMEFLAQTEVWRAKDQAAVRKWFEEYLRWLVRSPAGEEEKAASNDHASWWAAQAAAVASFVENEHELQSIVTQYRERTLPRLLRPLSHGRREEALSRSLPDWIFILEAHTTVCRIAQVHKVSLWAERSNRGATLAMVMDSLDPLLSAPKKPSREQIPDFASNGVYFLAFAGMGMNKPEYIALYRKWERPETAWLDVMDLLVGRWEAAGHQTRH